jgi:hypothetical protein
VNKTTLLGILFALAVVGVIIYSTMGLAKYRVEVCMTFHDHTDCRTASADSEEHALRSATNNACALIASGVTDSIACEQTPPKSVRWLKR